MGFKSRPMNKHLISHGALCLLVGVTVSLLPCLHGVCPAPFLPPPPPPPSSPISLPPAHFYFRYKRQPLLMGPFTQRPEQTPEGRDAGVSIASPKHVVEQCECECCYSPRERLLMYIGLVFPSAAAVLWRSAVPSVR